MQLAIVAGLALMGGAATLFGVFGGSPIVGVINAAAFTVLVAAGVVVTIIALLLSFLRGESRYLVLLVVSYGALAAAGIAFLTLLPDPVPFISTVTNSILSIFFSWVIFERKDLFRTVSRRRRAAVATNLGKRVGNKK